MPELHLPLQSLTNQAQPDMTLHYERQGAGPPILMLPGLLSDSASWGPLLPLLTPHHDLICPDPRSTGRTRPMTAPLSTELIIDDMIALLDHLDLPRIALLGHSFGATIARRMAQRIPGRVTTVICLAAAPRADARLTAIFDTLTEIRAQTGETLWLKALFPWLFHAGTFAAPGALEAMAEASRAYPHAQSLAAMQMQVDAFRSSLDAPPLDGAQPPTLALLGEDDALIAAIAAKAAWTPTGAHVRCLPNAAHALHWDQPKATAAAILNWLTETRP